MEPIEWIALATVLLSGAAQGWQAYAGTVARADAKKIMAKQTLEQQLQAVAQQNRLNKAKADAATTQVGALRAALSQPAPTPAQDNTPLIIGGAVLGFLLLRKAK